MKYKHTIQMQVESRKPHEIPLPLNFDLQKFEKKKKTLMMLDNFKI